MPSSDGLSQSGVSGEKEKGKKQWLIHGLHESELASTKNRLSCLIFSWTYHFLIMA